MNRRLFAMGVSSAALTGCTSRSGAVVPRSSQVLSRSKSVAPLSQGFDYRWEAGNGRFALTRHPSMQLLASASAKNNSFTLSISDSTKSFALPKMDYAHPHDWVNLGEDVNFRHLSDGTREASNKNGTFARMHPASDNTVRFERMNNLFPAKTVDLNRFVTLNPGATTGASTSRSTSSGSRTLSDMTNENSTEDGPCVIGSVNADGLKTIGCTSAQGTPSPAAPPPSWSQTPIWIFVPYIPNFPISGAWQCSQGAIVGGALAVAGAVGAAFAALSANEQQGITNIASMIQNMANDYVQSGQASSFEEGASMAENDLIASGVITADVAGSFGVLLALAGSWEVLLSIAVALLTLIAAGAILDGECTPIN